MSTGRVRAEIASAATATSPILRANPNGSWRMLVDVKWSYEAMVSGRALALVASIAACHPSGKGTQPQDMGARQHEQHAQDEKRVAAEHDELAADSAVTSSSGCSSAVFDVCWTSPTSEDHVRMAEEHRERAAKHRAASGVLRDAEARACKDIGDADRVTSPFDHREDLDLVATTEVEVADGRGGTQLGGARLVFRPVAGLTQAWLDRLVQCHIARNAALGVTQAEREMPSCPLTLPGIHAAVAPAGDGFAVEITARDGRTAKEIVRRARALAGDPAGTTR